MNDWNFARNIAGVKLLVELGMDYGVDEKMPEWHRNKTFRFE
jgi:hypothetical protein